VKGGSFGLHLYLVFTATVFAYRLEDFHRGHLLLGILGSGARKP
jgi:hypothetical protein